MFVMNEKLLKSLKLHPSRGESQKLTEEGDALIIDCRSCTYAPEPGSSECFRCMVDSMSCSGGSSRIILRAGKDIEVSGRSGDTIRKLASLKRWSIPIQECARECRRCDLSRKVIISSLWEEFPNMDFGSAMESLDTTGRNEGCSVCLRSTRRALEQLQSDIDSVNDLLRVRI